MTIKQLGNRVKMVGKSARKGKHEKLLVFYYALAYAELENLAASTKNILESIQVSV